MEPSSCSLRESVLVLRLLLRPFEVTGWVAAADLSAPLTHLCLHLGCSGQFRVTSDSLLCVPSQAHLCPETQKHEEVNTPGVDAQPVGVGARTQVLRPTLRGEGGPSQEAPTLPIAHSHSFNYTPLNTRLVLLPCLNSRACLPNDLHTPISWALLVPLRGCYGAPGSWSY